MTELLNLKLYGPNDEVSRELTRSIIPWGILEKAIDLQEQFQDMKVDAQGNPQNISREKIASLTEFVIFVFDDQVTADELKRYASLGDMFAVYTQIFAMVTKVMEKNPITALTPTDESLKTVRQGKKRKR
jgi:hypothetical protein